MMCWHIQRPMTPVPIQPMRVLPGSALLSGMFEVAPLDGCTQCGPDCHKPDAQAKDVLRLRVRLVSTRTALSRLGRLTQDRGGTLAEFRETHLQHVRPFDWPRLHVH